MLKASSIIHPLDRRMDRHRRPQRSCTPTRPLIHRRAKSPRIIARIMQATMAVPSPPHGLRPDDEGTPGYECFVWRSWSKLCFACCPKSGLIAGIYKGDRDQVAQVIGPHQHDFTAWQRDTTNHTIRRTR